jgi:hypothetical protein
MNEIIIDGNIYNLIGIWKKTKTDRSVDSKGHQYIFPTNGKPWSGSEQFIKRLMDIQTYIENNEPKKKIKYKNKSQCLLCSEHIVKNRYILSNYIWDDSLIHYIKKHNYEPHRNFIDKIFEFDITTKETLNLKGRMTILNSATFLKLERNQIMILDALMRH